LCLAFLSCSGFPDIMAATIFLVTFLTASFLAQAELEIIGGHQCDVFNAQGQSIIVIFHGYGAAPEMYHNIASRFVELGYAVVVPRDNVGAFAIFAASTWGPKVAAAVRDDWARGRPIAIMGHSMGGAAAMAAARFTQGISAYVAMHPAPIISGNAFKRLQGPILFTTGTYDNGVFCGVTSPKRAQESYSKASLPKALVNVRGDGHGSSQSAQGMEWMAVSSWIGCFMKNETNSCTWLRIQMCSSAALEWCYFEFGQEFGMPGFKGEAKIDTGSHEPDPNATMVLGSHEPDPNATMLLGSHEPDPSATTVLV